MRCWHSYKGGYTEITWKDRHRAQDRLTHENVWEQKLRDVGTEEITWKALICGQSSTKEITWRDEGGVARLEKHTLFTFLCKYIWVAGEAHTKVVLQLIFVFVYMFA